MGFLDVLDRPIRVLTGMSWEAWIASTGIGGGAVHFFGVDIAFGVIIGIVVFFIVLIIRKNKKKKRRYKR